MAEAGPSDKSEIEKPAKTDQISSRKNGAAKKIFEKSRGKDSTGRRGNLTSVSRDRSVSFSDTTSKGKTFKPTSKGKSGKQNSQQQGSNGSQADHARRPAPKQFMQLQEKQSSPHETTGLARSTSLQGVKGDRKPPKFSRDSRACTRPRSGRNQQFMNSSIHKACHDKNLESNSAQSPCQRPCSVVTDAKKPITSRGTVSNGIYVPRNKLANRMPDFQIRQCFNDNTIGNNQTQMRNSHSKRFDNVAKLNADFRGFAMKMHSAQTGSVQAGVLIDQLTDEKYECMVCCELIRCPKAVWSCSNCFHIFHLYCIKRWARSPAASIEDDKGKICGWRCPACQFVEHNVPNSYRCFCGKVEEPKWYPQDGITPHSCGELCFKKRVSKDCSHPCNQLCHPGPCPSCPVTITTKCSCGKTTMSVRCGNSTNLTCPLICGKTLNCGVHLCQETCHAGSCEPCTVLEQQSCYCRQTKAEALCGVGCPSYIDGKAGYFSCGAVCSKKLDCGNHKCKEVCHSSKCRSCELQPDVVSLCPCGKISIVQLLNGKNRSSCLEPIPTCGNICDGFLPCAKYNDLTKGGPEHRCIKLCHHGDCSVCTGDSIVKCRCRATSKKMKCVELLSLSGEPFMCERKCNKKFDCGRHRCSQKCCPGKKHNCTLTCGKKLKCGQHKCMEPCHAGTCPPCLMAGFDEVFCPCGATVQEPPIPCGKPPPVCHRPCSRMHSCEHEVEHNCHYEEQCPPCTVLVSKCCMGKHKLRHNIPCHVDTVSCGEMCGKPLPCGKHNCLKGCHKPPCLKENECCKQACISPRESCGHPCGAQCHEGECPKISCKRKVRIYCPCGRKCEDAVCLKGGDKMDVAQAYQRFTTKNLAEKMKGLQEGQSVDISGLMNLDERKSQLDCDEECRRQQRNRDLAEALGIPESSSKAEIVQYSHFLEEHGRGNMKLVYVVEDALDNLMKNVAKVQSQNLNYTFAPMNNKNRRFIHELAAMYGCTTMSYDQEPNRNTVVTANKDSRCPRVKLSSQIQRQTNPQPPPPVAVLPEQGIGNVKFIPRRKSQDMDVIDYFADDF